MTRIACDVANKNGYEFISMGNSLGQVASQTPQNLYVTDKFSNLPIFCPLLGYNKEDIINDARKAGTYEHSICNGNDCCVMYLPKNPTLKASPEYISKVINEIGDVNKYIRIIETNLS